MDTSSGQNKRVRIRIRRSVETFGSSPTEPLKIPPSPEETKPKINPLSRLMPPQPISDNQMNNEILQQRHALIPQVKSLLVSDLISMHDVEKMVDVANNSFQYLNLLCADYLSFYRVVYAYISYQYDRETVEAERKNSCAFKLKARYEELEAHAKEASEEISRATTKLYAANQKMVPLRVKIAEVKEFLSKLEDKLSLGNDEIEALEKDKSRSSEAYDRAANELICLGSDIDDARAVVCDIEQRLDTAISGINHMRDVLMSLV